MNDKLTEDVAKELILAKAKLSDKGDIDNADAVLQVSMKANKKLYDRIKEDDAMCEALRELMAPEIEEELRIRGEAEKKAGREAGIKEGIREGIKEGIKVGSENVFDIQEKLKAGESKDNLIGQGYDKDIVERSYMILFG